ncbi:MAG: glycosyl transferase family 36 [Candidatus Marinimicrobia bacterium]|nr:glycosyl transferase family 36 [Candidatus Neomarinimicrobiota bacterium]
MKYGCFSEDGKEFIISKVNTPTPWINYLYNDEYFATISNNGGGISYFKSPLHGRITRYRLNSVPYDRPGKYLYIRDNDTSEYWSLTWQPTNRDVDQYQVIHGFGYTKALSEINNIKGEVTFFVPRTDNQEIWKVSLNNLSNQKRCLSVYGYVEFSLGHGHVDLINQCDDQHFNRLNFDRELNTLFATKTYWVTGGSTQQQENKSWDRYAFFTVNNPISAYETLRENFIGLYRNENNPAGIELNQMTSRDIDFGNSVGAIRTEIEINPGESADLIFSLGVISKMNFAVEKNNVQKYHSIPEVNMAFEGVKNYWDQFFSKVSVETPEKRVNHFMNYWTPYQGKVAFDIGRVASFYYWGISRGFGFRDTAQDTIATTISYPEKAKDRILLLSRQMFSYGKTYHHFHADGQGETTGHCDDPLWYLLALTDYIQETGDFGILKIVEPFIDNKSGTVLEHAFSVLTFIKNNKGKHGLPIFGRGDWNDTLDYIGGDDGGESVWGGLFYITMLNRFIDLLQRIQKKEMLMEVISVRDEISDAINNHCWDGEWFIRAFGEKDKKIGSKENKFGKIFLNSQSWAVLGKVSNPERLLQAMNSVKKHLDSEFGPKICAPAYTEIDEKIGLVTRCVAGKKENGAIFCHPTTWLIQAECLLGRGNIAYDYYKKLLPDSIDQDIFKAEPYVYSQYITSNEHSFDAGHASHSWQTGTAAWMYRTSIDYMLGVRATYDGLMVDPVIHENWETVKVNRYFRGTNYKITIENPEKVEKGIKLIYVNNKKYDSQVLPFTDEKELCIKVIMGKE